MLYDVRLTISHRYASPAGNSRHLVRVLPKAIAGRQSITAHLVEVDPVPDRRADRIDFFGNSVASVVHNRQHERMAIRMACRVDVHAGQVRADMSSNLPELHNQVASLRDLGPASPLHFLGPSYRLTPNSEIAQFARDVVQPGASVADMVTQVGRALHQVMTFDANATTVDTDPAEAFGKKRGVCQDLSHIMILGLQALGIPAGYVSGYLRTLPPKGGVRLEGVDAMHAWVQAWCGPSQGWIEYDPTNATLVGADHIVVGYGRDYSDVSPVVGQLRSSGSQVNKQSVDVAPVEPDPAM